MYCEQVPDDVKEFVAFVQAQEEDGFDDEAEEEFPSDAVTEANLSDDAIAVLYELYQELAVLRQSAPRHECCTTPEFPGCYGGAYLFRSLIPDTSLALNSTEEMESHCLAVALSCSGRTFLKSTTSRVLQEV